MCFFFSNRFYLYLPGREYMYDFRGMRSHFENYYMHTRIYHPRGQRPEARDRK